MLIKEENIPTSQNLSRRDFLKFAIISGISGSGWGMLISKLFSKQMLDQEKKKLKEIPVWKKANGYGMAYYEQETVRYLGEYEVYPETGNLYSPPIPNQQELKPISDRSGINDFALPYKGNNFIKHKKNVESSTNVILSKNEKLDIEYDAITELTKFLAKYKYPEKDNGPRHINIYKIEDSGLLVTRVTDLDANNRLFVYNPKNKKITEILKPEIEKGQQLRDIWVYPEGIFVSYRKNYYEDPTLAILKKEQQAVYFYPLKNDFQQNPKGYLVSQALVVENLGIERVLDVNGIKRFLIRDRLECKYLPIIQNSDNTMLCFTPWNKMHYAWNKNKKGHKEQEKDEALIDLASPSLVNILPDNVIESNILSKKDSGGVYFSSLKGFIIDGDQIFAPYTNLFLTPTNDVLVNRDYFVGEIKLVGDVDNRVMNDLNEEIRRKDFKIKKNGISSSDIDENDDIIFSVKIGVYKDRNTALTTMAFLYTGEEANKYLLIILQQDSNKKIKYKLHDLVIPKSAPRDSTSNPILDLSYVNLMLKPIPGDTGIELLYSPDDIKLGKAGEIIGVEFIPDFGDLYRIPGSFDHQNL